MSVRPVELTPEEAAFVDTLNVKAWVAGSVVRQAMELLKALRERSK